MASATGLAMHRANCPQVLQASESDSLAFRGSTMGERMHAQLLTKDQINAQLERLDQKIKELETDDILGVIDEPKRAQESQRIQLNKLEASNILDIIDERSKRIQGPPRIQSNDLETSDILAIIEEPGKRIQEPPRPSELETSDILAIIEEPSKRIQEPPRIYEKQHLANSRLYQVGEFIVSAVAIFAIILAVIFTALITATLGEIIQQFSVRQYVSVMIFASILFGLGYFVGCARKG
jgi:hypothetical protein